MPDLQNGPGPGDPVTPLPKARVRTYMPEDDLFSRIPMNGKAILPGGEESTKYVSGITPYTDPFFTGGPDRDWESRMKAVEGGIDAVQPWYDKLGNGVVKMAGSFADGMLSTVGTIYGIPASIISLDKTQMWDNPFTNLGQDISDSISSNFQNYRSIGEQNANAWSPNYWMSWNFFSDNILGNLGYAASAYVTGGGISKVLGKLAPFIAGKNLATGLDIINAGGVEALKDMSQAYNAVKRWDAIQQGISVGISASGEASVEALTAYKEGKQKMTDLEAEKYGGVENIPDSVLQRIDEDAKSVGNITYGLNLPVLAGADLIQWGKSLSGFNSEFKQMSKNAAKLTALEEFGTYAAKEDLIKTGVGRGMARALSATGNALKSNLSEAGQEGAQFIISEGTKSWYQRDHDIHGWDGVREYNDPYVDALVKLVTTQEGVANLLGGFAGGAPFGFKDYVRAIAGDPAAKALMDKQTTAINSPFLEGTIRDNLKVYLKNMARHASAENDLQAALSTGDEKIARDAKFDQLKTYINSRIETGRMDLLGDEITQLKQLTNDQFKSFFNLDANDNVDKDAILDKFQNTAEDMHNTYKMMDRLFNPDMYRLNNLPPDERDKKLEDLHQYKTMLWSYMMDYKDRDNRAKQLDAEVGKAFGGLLNTAELFKDQFKTDQLNDIYRQYVATNVEHELNKQSNPQYKNSTKEAEITSLKSRLKSKMEELIGDNITKMATMEEFQGTGKKDFIEDYIFNVNKRIIPTLNNPIAQTALNLTDINQVVSKTHDLVDLHADRRMAIHSYNQLASAIKSGEFLNQYVNNPAYDKEKHKDVPAFIEQVDDEGETVQTPNPEYVPERIPSEEMLNYDGYATRKNERQDFYKEQRRKKDENKAEQDAFNQELDDLVDPTLTDKSKQFHNRVKEFINGSEKIGSKPLRTLTANQLQIQRAFAHRNMQAAEMRGDFAINTKKERDNFDRNKFIDVYAYAKAIEDEIGRRAAIRQKAIDKAAEAVVKYVYAHKIDPAALVSGFKINNRVIDEDILKRAVAMIAEDQAKAQQEEALKRQKAAATQTQTAPKQPTASKEDEPLVDDELYALFQKNNRDRDVYAEVSPDIAKKLSNGTPLTPRENEIYQAFQSDIDKKVKAKYGIDPIYKVKTVQAGSYVPQEPIIISPEVTAENIKEGIKETGKAAEAIAPRKLNGAFIRLRRSDLETTADGKQNRYDENGNAIAKQLTFSLFDPTNDLNLHNKPQLRFKFTNSYSDNGGKKEPTMILMVRAKDEDTWQSTNYFMQGIYNMEGKEAIGDKQFSKDEAENKELKDAYHALIRQMQNDAIKNGYVDVEIKGGISFGSLIENKRNEDGIVEPRGLIDSFGNDINSEDPHSVKLGVLLNDSQNDATAVYKDENAPAGELTDVNNMPGVYVPKSLINAVANANGKGTGDRGGQYIALLPTGQMTSDGSKQIHFPVLLSGKALSDFTTAAYNIGSGRNKGTKANIGEVLIDALLNPYKAEYNDLFPSLFEMSGLTRADYKGPDLTDWKAFYNDARIHNLINRVFFSSGKTLDNATEYKRPFKFEIVDTNDRGGAIMARIGISDPLLKDRRTVDIFLSTKDGKLVKPQNDQEREDFTQHRIDQTYAFRKEQGKTDAANVSYADIQDVVKDKVFHVEIVRMSETTPKPFTGLVFDKDGKLTGRQFSSYHHYVDELGLAQATVQGIVNPKTGQRQYFVNQRVYLAPKEIATTVESKNVKTKAEKIAKPIDPENTILGVDPAAKGAVTGTTTVKITGKPSAEAQKNAEKEAMKGGMGAVRAANNIMGNRRNGKKAMMDLNTYRSIAQRSMTSMGTAYMHTQELITDEITSLLMDKLIEAKQRKRGAIAVGELKASLKDSILRQAYSYMQKARPTIADISFSDWKNLDEEHPDRQSLDNLEIEKLTETELSQHDTLMHAYYFFDIDEFNDMFKKGEMGDELFNQLFVGGTAEDPLFFAGYANNAMMRLAQLNIVKAVNTGGTEVELDEETGNYTQRFNDSWALMINPKDTLGLQAKITLNSIDDIEIINHKDGTISIEKQRSETGFTRRMKYDTVFTQLVNLAMDIQPENFETELMSNPGYDSSPVIKAVRMKLQEINNQKGVDTYKQIIQQLATTLAGLRINDVTQAILTKNPKFNVMVKIMSGAKSNLSGQVVERWQGQFANAISRNDYIRFEDTYHEQTGIFVTKPILAQFKYEAKTNKGTEIREGDFADVFTNTVKEIYAAHTVGKNTGKLTMDGYRSLALLIHDMLGIQLVENDFKNKDKAGMGTAVVLRDIAETFNEKVKKEDRILGSLLAKANIKSFSDFINRTFNDNIVNQIRRAVKEGTYNENEPFRNSGTAMDLLARMFQPWQESLTNPQAKTGTGKNQYVYVTADMLNHEFRRLRSEEIMNQLKGLPILEYDFHFQQQFKDGQYSPRAYWKNITVNSIDSLKLTSDVKRRRKGKNKGEVISARSAPAGDVDIMSMVFYQNEEDSKPNDNIVDRGTAKYFLPFGDSSAASYMNFNKFAFSFEYNNGKLVLGQGQVREMIYGTFKSEVNKALRGFQAFNEINDNPDLTLQQKKDKLDKGYHYYERQETDKDGNIKEVLIPGSVTRMYYFGRKVYELTDNHPVYETMEVNGEYRPISLKEGMVDANDNLVEDKVRAAFDAVVDDFLSDVINSKLKQLEPIKDSFFELEDPEMVGEKYTSPAFKSNIMDTRYINSLKRIFQNNSTIDGKNLNEYYNDDLTQFDTKEAARDNGYHAQLLKTAVIDQQINAFIANTLLRKLTWDFSAFDDNGNYDTFMQVLGKRESAFNSPFAVTASKSNVDTIIFNDVLYGNKKIALVDIEQTLMPEEKALFAFLKNNGLGKHVTDKVPARYKELAAILYAAQQDKLNNTQIAKILKAALNSKLTDGGSVITLREYLYQMQQQGVISYSDFGRLYTKYSDPNLIMTEKDTELLFKGQKMVGIGSVIVAGRKAPVYIKDAKIVMIPALVKGTRYETILEHLHGRESKSLIPSPGIQLVPASGAKRHNGKVIDLFDQDDNIVSDAIANAQIFTFPRTMYGEQVQNPNKKTSKITTGIQLQKYMFSNVHDDKIFGEDMFSSPRTGTEVVIHTAASKVYGKTDGKKIPEKGLYKIEARDNMIGLIRQMNEYKLQDLVDRFGLDYDISGEWKNAANDEGYTDYEAFQAHIDRLENSLIYEERQQAKDLNYRKYSMVARTIAKMVNDIKQQAYTKKGIEISQLRVLNEVLANGDGKDKTEKLRMSLTFTPGNRQFQQVILAEIESLFAHTKHNGFGGIQISSAGHEKIDLPGPALKGYGLKYNADGKVIGFDHAEIGVPWIFKDVNGKLLEYSKYVNEDGTPKPEMFDPEVLNIVGYRIPNTGLNMAGSFRIARFFKPGYTDSIMIPDILFSQMGTDLDFDKLYTYVYNNRVDATGKVTKVRGVINTRQNNAKAILNSDESKRWAIHNSLMQDDPGYKIKYKLFKQAIQKLNNRLAELQPSSEEEEQQNNNIFIGMDPKEMAALKAKLDKDAVNDNAEAFAQLKSQFESLTADFDALQATIARKQKSFNHEGWINAKRDNYLKAQSYQQLENAYFDIYHMVMSDMDMLPAMLTPLTSDLVTEQVDDKKYNGRSISQMESSSIVEAPNTEAYQIKVRGDNKSSNENIGALANGQSTIDAFQTANLSVGSKTEDGQIRPIVFLDEKGNIIEEDENDTSRFVSPIVNDEKNIGYAFQKMQLNLASAKQVYNIPHRLGRIYGVNGKTKVTEVVQSALQAFLDFNNNRGVAHTNINLATLNPMMAMVGLGYTDHIFDFFGQEILKDYTKGYYAEQSPFIQVSDSTNAIVRSYVRKAGLSDETWSNYVDANDGNVENALHQMLIDQKLGDQKTDYEKFFSQKELHDMISTQYSEDKNSQYYIHQLFVLDMFNRLQPIGQQAFYLLQSINLESKGFTNMSILGALDQIRNHNNVGKLINPINGQVSFEGLIGSEKLGPWSKDDNPHGMQTVHTAALAYAKKGMEMLTRNTALFSDLSPMFINSRYTLSTMTGKFSLGNQERFNINTIQYILSNPALYKDFLDVIPEQDRNTAHDIRKHIFMDDLEIIHESKNGIGKIKTKVLEPGLARRIEDIKTQKDEESGITYSDLYPVLNYFNTRVKNSMDSPSWVTTSNTSQFKERLGQEMPFNIQRMLVDSNPEIQKIAKYMFLYYYLGNGVTTPTSFGHLLPQEWLFKEGGFADTLSETMDNLNRQMEALKREVSSSRTRMDYDRPYWFRQFDPTIVKVNREASALQLALYTQYLQNNPFEAEIQGYEAGKEFEATDNPNIVRILPAGKVTIGESTFNPKSFMEISTDGNTGQPSYTLYVINSDYNTYTRVNRAGLTNYTEYNYGQPFTPTLVRRNQLSQAESLNTTENNAISENAVLGSPVKVLKNADSLVPVKMDIANDLNSVYQQVFLNDDTRKLDEFSQYPIEDKELSAIATALFPSIPANTVLIPYSIKKAKKDFQTSNGLISVNGREAFGSFRAGNPNGIVELAYDFIDRDKTDPLLLKKALLHESAHAATSNVFTVLEKLNKKELTKSEVASILKLDRMSEDGPIGEVQNMSKAYQKFKDIFEYLKSNTVLRKAYIEQVKASNNKAKDVNIINQLDNVIMGSVDEFTAWMFNSKQFRDALKAVPYKDKKNIFDRILDFLKEVLGLKPGTAAYSAFGNIFEILEPIKGSKIATEGWNTEDIDRVFSANPVIERKALFNLEEQYKGVSNFDSQYASPEELKLYDRLVKEGKIIC